MKYAYYYTPMHDIPIKIIKGGGTVVIIETPSGREADVDHGFIKDDDGEAEVKFVLWRATAYWELWDSG